jgi:PAS domain S-box-containing protein
LFLYSVHLWFLTSAVLAVGTCVLALGWQRQRRAVGEFSDELFQRLVENVNHAVLVHRGQILFANARCLTLLGTAAADVIGRPLSAFVAADYVQLVDENLRRRLAGEAAAERYEVELIGSDGELSRVELSSALIDRDGAPALLLTALEMLPPASTPGSPSQPRALATLDAMAESVITVEANGRIDYLNPSAATLLGASVDQVIGRTFAEVASLVDEADLTPLGDPLHLASTAGTRVTLRPRAMLVPANGGAGRCVELGVTPLGLKDAAAQGWVLVLHDLRDRRGLTRPSGETYWLQRLQGALRDNRFELYCQPIMHAQIDGVGGPSIEIFVRLSAENGQPRALPAEFIRAAERHRLMPLVDRWVVQAVLSAMGCGALKLPAGRSVAINIAGQTLGDPEFLEFVVDCLDNSGANPNAICFEVTEDSVIANLDRARRFVAVLHDLGCEFALDDFGGDLSFFPTLQTLPMDYLKIDGAFIRTLAQDTGNQALLTAIIDLSHSRNFRVLAGQVEDQSSLETVKRMGVDFVQGFAIARPEPLPMTAGLEPSA